MVDFDFGGFIGDVAGDLGVEDQSDLAAVAAKGITDGVARIKDQASAQGSNPPVVTPTAYVQQQLPNLKMLGVQLSPNQVKILKVGAVAVGVFVLYKVLKRRK